MKLIWYHFVSLTDHTTSPQTIQNWNQGRYAQMTVKMSKKLPNNLKIITIIISQAIKFRKEETNKSYVEWKLSSVFAFFVDFLRN